MHYPGLPLGFPCAPSALSWAPLDSQRTTASPRTLGGCSAHHGLHPGFLFWGLNLTQLDNKFPCKIKLLYSFFRTFKKALFSRRSGRLNGHRVLTLRDNAEFPTLVLPSLSVFCMQPHNLRAFSGFRPRVLRVLLAHPLGYPEYLCALSWIPLGFPRSSCVFLGSAGSPRITGFFLGTSSFVLQFGPV